MIATKDDLPLAFDVEFPARFTRTRRMERLAAAEFTAPHLGATLAAHAAALRRRILQREREVNPLLSVKGDVRVPEDAHEVRVPNALGLLHEASALQAHHTTHIRLEAFPLGRAADVTLPLQRLGGHVVAATVCPGVALPALHDWVGGLGVGRAEETAALAVVKNRLGSVARVERLGASVAISAQ